MNLPLSASTPIAVSLIGAVAQFGLGLLLLILFSSLPKYGSYRDLIRTWLWAWVAYTVFTSFEAVAAVELLSGKVLLPVLAAVITVALGIPIRWLFLALVMVAALQAAGHVFNRTRLRNIALSVPATAFLLSLILPIGTLLSIEFLAVPAILAVGLQLLARSSGEQRNRGLTTLAVAVMVFALLRVPQLLIETTLQPSWINAELGRFIAMLSPWADLVSLVVLASGVVLFILQESVVQATKDREAFERKTAEAEKMVALGRVMSGVAHELNNPLSVVLGEAEQLANGSVGSDVNSTSLELIHQNAIRARHIVRDLLTFVRRPQDSHEATALRRLIDSIVTLQSTLLAEQGVTIHIEVPESLTVHGSPVALEQVFGNLIDNAVFAAGRDGTVWIRSNELPDGVEVRVEDSGPGVEERYLDRLFEPFFTTKPIGQGTGLGLSLANGVLGQYGGALTLDNRPRPGVGASMVALMQLPQAGDVLRQIPDVGDDSLPCDWRQIGRDLGVLVIDDESAVRSTIVRILRAWDWPTKDAASVDEALQILHDLADEEYPAAILCDMKMPGKSGADFFRTLLSEYPTLSNRVVFVTGNALEAGTAEFLAESGREVVEKPFTIDELSVALERSIGATAGAQG